MSLMIFYNRMEKKEMKMNFKWMFGVVAALWFSPALMAQCHGQVFFGPPVCQPAPVHCAPATYVDYILNANQSDQSRVWRKVHYQSNEWITVPVIDGYVPQVNVRGNRTIYDYRGKWRLSDVKYEGMPKSKPPAVVEEIAPRPRVQESVEPDLPLAPRPPRISEEPSGDGWKSVTPPKKEEVTPPKEEELKLPPAPKEETELKLNPPLRIIKPPVKEETPFEAPRKVLPESPLRLERVPEGLRRPSDIDDPPMRIVPTYEEKK